MTRARKHVDVVTRPVLAAAWDAAQRRAGVMGVLSVSPAAQAGEYLELFPVPADAISRAMLKVSLWRARGDEEAAEFWVEVRDQLIEIGRIDALRAAEKRTA